MGQRVSTSAVQRSRFAPPEPELELCVAFGEGGLSRWEPEAGPGKRPRRGGEAPGCLFPLPRKLLPPWEREEGRFPLSHRLPKTTEFSHSRES